MKRRSTQGNAKTKNAKQVITYPPGYKGQPLTEDLIIFSDSLTKCPANYRGVFKMLLKQFAADLGCGDSEKSQEYLTAIANGNEIIWGSEDLPAVVIVSAEEMCKGKRKRVLKIMPTLQFIEHKLAEYLPSEAYQHDVDLPDKKALIKASAKVFH